MTDAKQQILGALRAFARQRPGLEFGNYGDAKAYRAEMRGITRDLAHAQTLLKVVEWSGIDADALIRAARDAFSGRLSINTMGADTACTVHIDYCTGQYWPTEYRKAVCAVLASALWERCRDQCMPAPTLHHNSETGETVQRYRGLRAGDYMRAHFQREFGRGIASRYFN